MRASSSERRIYLNERFFSASTFSCFSVLMRFSMLGSCSSFYERISLISGSTL
jgi:hypothetical protein